MATVHWQHGLFAQNNGIEVPLLYGVAAVALALDRQRRVFAGRGARPDLAGRGGRGWRSASACSADSRTSRSARPHRPRRTSKRQPRRTRSQSRRTRRLIKASCSSCLRGCIDHERSFLQLCCSRRPSARKRHPSAAVSPFPTGLTGTLVFQSRHSRPPTIPTAAITSSRIDLATGAVTQLTSGRNHHDQHPRWSPDGTRISFMSVARRQLRPLCDGRRRHAT